MQTNQDLEKEIQFTHSIKSLISSKEEISVMRIQKIRDFVLKTRDFTTRLSSVVSDIRSSYSKELGELGTDASLQQIIKFSVSVKRSAWVSVLITPNTRLAGTIVPKVYSLFLDSAGHSFSEIVIIGTLGRQLYEQSGLTKPVKYFEVSESNIELEDMQDIIDYLSGFAKIDVYYGKLYSLVTQEAVKTDITGDKLLFDAVKDQIIDTDKEQERKFLFEPEIREILMAMEIQFLALFFQQIIQESTLAQLGSRISFMEESSSKIDDVIKKLNLQEKILKRAVNHRKMQQTFAGLSLWN